MAISRKIGQDSEGVPIFKLDDSNNPTNQLDCDLGEILEDFCAFKNGEFNESEYRFSIKKSQIDDELRINPQAYLPHLNQTLRKIQRIDELPEWTVLRIPEIDHNVEIFKGPWLKSENLVVERIENGTTEPYYTPSAMLQEKADSVKYLDIAKANSSQLRTIKAIRIKHGDILITRSGSIGRVKYITSKFHNAILSDDAIRVRIPNEDKRFYVYAYLQTKYAQDQMFRNEYGAIQQHLEPLHIKNLMIPVPHDWTMVKPIIDHIRKIIESTEALHRASHQANEASYALLNAITQKANGNGGTTK